MDKFLTALGTIVVVIVALVAADQITGALERARVKRAATKAAATAAAAAGAATTTEAMRVAA